MEAAICHLQETITQLIVKQRTVHSTAFFLFRHTWCKWPMEACNSGAIVLQCWPEELAPIAALYMTLPQNGYLAKQIANEQHWPWTLDLSNRRQSCTGHTRNGLGDKSICTLREFPQSPNSAKTLHNYSLNKTLHITNPTATVDVATIISCVWPEQSNASVRTLREFPQSIICKKPLHKWFLNNALYKGKHFFCV